MAAAEVFEEENELSEESEGLLSEDSEEGEITTEKKPPNPASLRSCYGSFVDHVFPLLTTDNGVKKLSRKRSITILCLLYISHALSAWGDRMWGFANSLFIAMLYPGSLLLPGVFGFIVQFFVVIFGTIVGDWVDTNRRMKVIVVSLVVQNSLVAMNAALLSFMFYYSLTVCNNVLIFGILMVGVVLLGALANLATTGNTIAVERDWVVVIADKNATTLAALNANMRRIDLACKLIAPIVAGVLLTHTNSLLPSLPADMAGGFVATVFIGVWNIVSFFGELGLIYLVYQLLPSLKIKKLRTQEKENKEKENKEKEEGEASSDMDVANNNGEGVADDKPGIVEEQHYDEVEKIKQAHETKGMRPFIGFLKKLATPYWTLRNGWGIFWRQEINLVGFAMASLYLTVLGFSGVTATYFLTQGVTSDLIGLFQGIGGIMGICGTFAFPFLHKRLGTVKTGVVGNVLQVSALVFSVVGVFVPGRPLPDDSGQGYYSVNCSLPSPSPTIDPSLFPSPSLLVSPSPTASSDSSSTLSINLSVILVLVGVTGARFGLWIFDLAVSQLVQERVVEEERGVVSGVMNAMNSNMDMLHYVMVIVAPRPQDFSYLTIISFLSVSTGMVFYLFFVRRVYNLRLRSVCACCSTTVANRNIPRQTNTQQSIINASLDLDS